MFCNILSTFALSLLKLQQKQPSCKGYNVVSIKATFLPVLWSYADVTGAISSQNRNNNNNNSIKKDRYAIKQKTASWLILVIYAYL